MPVLSPNAKSPIIKSLICLLLHFFSRLLSRAVPPFSGYLCPRALSFEF